MKKRHTKSLSTKIVFSIALISFIITLIIYTVSNKINKEAFYQIEVEKAHLIASTIEPLIAINIYLDMPDKITQVTKQLMQNHNILAVKIVKENKIIDEIKSADYNSAIHDAFEIQKEIFQPNSKEQIATLTLVYSNRGHKELVSKYKNLTLALLLVLIILFIFFGLYIKQLFSPFREIANTLKEYSPNKDMKIPFSSRNDEIGLISNALNHMQEKISEYANEQKNINLYLEEKVNEKTLELRKQLYTDTLTGLPNRFSLLNDLANIKDGALLVINIDDFKEINDFFGHIAGDYILKEFSKTLLYMFKNNNNIDIKRLSGDEFTLLFMKKPSLEEFIAIAKKIVYDIEKTIFAYENSEIGIRVSIGGSYELYKSLEKADIALKSAKKEHKSFLIYDEKLNVEEQYKDNMEWVKKLKTAIKKSKIVPFFQPIFDNDSDKISSYECLIRLIDEDEKIVSPYLFLTVAKKSRLYNKLTKIMVDKSCKFFENKNYDFSINLSVEDILNKDTVDYIKYKVTKHNVAKKIIFEILESEGIENYEEISIFINEMRSLGCKIAIDDFGSGYSNFEHLLKLNINYIKIDGTLIKNLDKDINAQVIVQTIVGFAKKLNILTVAEFVHNEEIYKKVKELNVDRTQGFFLAQPQEKIV